MGKDLKGRYRQKLLREGTYRIEISDSNSLVLGSLLVCYMFYPQLCNNSMVTPLSNTANF